MKLQSKVTYEDCEPIEAIALHCEDCDRFYEGQAEMEKHLLSSGGTHRVVWLKERAGQSRCGALSITQTHCIREPHTTGMHEDELMCKWNF